MNQREAANIMHNFMLAGEAYLTLYLAFVFPDMDYDCGIANYTGSWYCIKDIAPNGKVTCGDWCESPDVPEILGLCRPIHPNFGYSAINYTFRDTDRELMKLMFRETEVHYEDVIL